MSQIYLFISHFDSYEPIHSLSDCRKQIYASKEEALARLKEERMDFGIIFEIDTEKLSIERIGSY